MSQPTPYTLRHEYFTDETANPNFPGSELDIEFNAVEDTFDQILANLALIQRDDGALKNAIVTVDALSDAVKAMIGDADVLAGLEADFAAVDANVALTAADVVLTHADVVLTHADVVTAAVSASTATTQAGTATTQAGIATAKAVLTAADSVATAADRVQTGLDAANAAASAAAAAISADNFDDVYLGSKAANPTLDNDGNALAEGQLYWNSVSNALKVYDGAAWQNYNPLSGISNVVEDTTPQLGGDLDLNGHAITGLSSSDSPQFAGLNIGHASDTTVTRTGAGDIAVEGKVIYRADGTDVALADGGTGASTAPAALTNLTARGQGKETIWVPAGAMTSRTSNGPSSGSVEMSTNKNMFKTLDFDTTTQEFAQFEIRMPKSWNLGAITFQPVWSHAATTTNFGVVWALQAVAISDDDAGDVAFGTEQTSIDTGGTTNDRYIAPESAAITVAGSPAAGDLVQFQFKRNPSDGSDTLAVDARLYGINVFYSTNAATDA